VRHYVPDTFDDLTGLSGRTCGSGHASLAAHKRDISGGVVLDMVEVSGKCLCEPVGGSALAPRSISAVSCSAAGSSATGCRGVKIGTWGKRAAPRGPNWWGGRRGPFDYFT